MSPSGKQMTLIVLTIFLSVIIISIAIVNRYVPQQILLTINDSETCPIYQCSSSDSMLQYQDQCFKEDLFNSNIIHLKTCPEGQLCHATLNRCQEDPYFKVISLSPGATCSSDYQCSSKNCLNSICQPVTDQQNAYSYLAITSQKDQVDEGMCQNHIDCAVGYFCNEGQKCEKQKALKDNCSNDFSCVNGLTCNLGQCVPYGSVQNFEFADNELACESGFASKINISEDEDLNYCLPTPQIINREAPNYQCNSPSDSCIYQTNLSDGMEVQVLQFQKKCSCGMNSLGNSYCPNIYSSQYTLLLATVTEKLGQNCHTTDRMEIYDCFMKNAKTEEDITLLNMFIVEHYERLENSKIRDNDSCVKKNSKVSQYWEAKTKERTLNPNLHKPAQTSASNIITKPSFFLLLLCYVVIVFLSYK